ncbi:hypothetical protein ACFQ0W_07000, partial [Streptococcus saliviloxodontae]|uniref:hypothetical protein n=1 Tax=Streptococcus saliviloxodontae TaxID=1349416 RepID=UPI00362CE2F5
HDINVMFNRKCSDYNKGIKSNKGSHKMNSIQFIQYYNKVRPTVYKLMKSYHLKLWTKEDWEQEAQIVLYQLIKKHREVLSEEGKLYVYFKTKFSNYIKDHIRKQESYKRRFDKMQYEEIWDNSNKVSMGGLQTVDYIAFNELIKGYQSQLSPEELEQFKKLERGERFRGREKMLKDLRVKLKDFSDDIY